MKRGWILLIVLILFLPSVFAYTCTDSDYGLGNRGESVFYIGGEVECIYDSGVDPVATVSVEDSCLPAGDSLAYPNAVEYTVLREYFPDQTSCQAQHNGLPCEEYVPLVSGNDKPHIPYVDRLCSGFCMMDSPDRCFPPDGWIDPSQCIDPDTNELDDGRYIKTTVTLEGFEYEDKCSNIDSTRLVEYVCDGNTLDSLSIDCSQGCLDGECQKTNIAPGDSIVSANSCSIPRCQDRWDNDGDNRIDYFGGCDTDSDGFIDYKCGCDLNGNGNIDDQTEVALDKTSLAYYPNCIDAGYEYGCIALSGFAVFDTDFICEDDDMYWPDFYCTSETDETEKSISETVPLQTIAEMIVSGPNIEYNEIKEETTTQKGFSFLEPVFAGLSIFDLNKMTGLFFVPSIVGWQVKEAVAKRVLMDQPLILAKGTKMTSRCNDGWDNDGNNRMDYLGGCDKDIDGWRDYVCGCDLNNDQKINTPDEVKMKYKKCLAQGNKFGCMVDKKFNTEEQCSGGVMFLPELNCASIADDNEKIKGLQELRVQI